MNIKELHSDKLEIINWITEIQDSFLVEQIKAIMDADHKPYKLSVEQEQILNERLMEDKSSFIPARELLNQLKKKYGL